MPAKIFTWFPSACVSLTIIWSWSLSHPFLQCPSTGIQARAVFKTFPCSRQGTVLMRTSHKWDRNTGRSQVCSYLFFFPNNLLCFPDIHYGFYFLTFFTLHHSFKGELSLLFLCIMIIGLQNSSQPCCTSQAPLSESSNIEILPPSPLLSWIRHQFVILYSFFCWHFRIWVNPKTSESEISEHPTT